MISSKGFSNKTSVKNIVIKYCATPKFSNAGSNMHMKRVIPYIQIEQPGTWKNQSIKV